MDLIERYCDYCGAAYTHSAAACAACGRSLKVTRELKQEAAVRVTPALRLTEHLQTLQLFKERYRIMSQVGVGGFGAVYEAFDTWEPRRVAIKEIGLSGLSAQQVIEATGSFNREVQMLSSLSHPGIPRMYEHTTDTEHWYLVMEFIPGKTLENIQEQAQRGCLPLEWILQIGVQISEILNYLHSRQPAVIFRDIKPANIMITPERNLYLIDFGVARRYQRERTRDTIAFGSPGYAPPEQYGRAQTTPLSDIYSLGALLYCLLTGDDPSTHPFKFSPLHLSGRAGGREMDAILLDRLIQQMVASDPVQRPQHVGAELRRIQQVHYHISHQSRRLAPIWLPPQGQTPPGLASSSGKRQSSPSTSTLSQPSVQPASSTMITLSCGPQQQQMILKPPALAPQSQPTTTTIGASSSSQQQQMVFAPPILAPQSQPTTTTIGASSSSQQMILAPGQQQAIAAIAPGPQQLPAAQALAQKPSARKTSRRRVLIGSLVAGSSVLTLSLVAAWRNSLNGTTAAPDPGDTLTTTEARSTAAASQAATANAQNQVMPETISQEAIVPVIGPTYWSTDLKYAVVGNPNLNQLEIYSINTQKSLHDIPVDGIYEMEIMWSPDNSKFFCSYGGFVWDVKVEQQLCTLSSDWSKGPGGVVWSPNSKYAAGSSPSLTPENVGIGVADTENGKTVFQKNLLGTNVANCIAWSPDSRSIVFPNTDNSTWTPGNFWSAAIVNIHTSQQIGTLSDYLPAKQDISSYSSASGIAWSPDGKIIAVTIDDNAWLCTLVYSSAGIHMSRATVMSIPLFTAPLWSPDGRYLAFFSRASLSVYDTVSGQSVILVHNSLPPTVAAIAWSANSKSIAATDDNNILFTWKIQ